MRRQIEANPLKYKLLLPLAVRHANRSSDSLLYREMQRMAKPQLVFVGATIPTEGTRNVAETIRDWLDCAVWIRTPGMHNVCPHIAQEFRFVPRKMEMDILNQILIGCATKHFVKNHSDSANEEENEDKVK